MPHKEVVAITTGSVRGNRIAIGIFRVNPRAERCLSQSGKTAKITYVRAMSGIRKIVLNARTSWRRNWERYCKNLTNF